MTPARDAEPDPLHRPRRVVVLGSTGSIGTQTLEVIDHLNDLARLGHPQALGRFEVVALAAGRDEAGLARQAQRWPNARAVLAARDGPDAARSLVESVACDVVVAAMVGAAGLPATLEAARRGIDIALANKETLVAAGALIVPAARASGARLLPVDSEHSALWQCLGGLPGAPAAPPMIAPASVARLTLTASGGPFRTWPPERVHAATPAEALRHPTWTMGAKVTIDSASLTNKAFELIEAHWLFGVGNDRLGAIIHPQSIIHSLVEFADASVLAQLGAPDMKAPISYALTFPHRPPGAARRLDLHALRALEFEPADHARFPALGLAHRVIDRGGVSGAIFNAASEEAVQAFLASAQAPRPRPFGRCVELAAEALDALASRAGPGQAAPTLEDVLEADRAARAFVRAAIARERTVISTPGGVAHAAAAAAPAPAPAKGTA